MGRWVEQGCGAQMMVMMMRRIAPIMVAVVLAFSGIVGIVGREGDCGEGNFIWRA
jgi:hypothetical protein